MLIRRVFLLVLLALPIAFTGAQGGEPAEEKAVTVRFGLDIGDLSEDLGGTLFAPFVAVGQYDLGLNWEARVRGMFTDKEDGVRASAVDGRGLVGWTWQWTDAISVGAVGGGWVGFFRIEHDESIGGGAYDFHAGAALVGVQAKVTGTEGLDLVGQFTAGPVLMYEDEGDNDFDLGSYFVEAYVGVDWHLPQYSMTINVGVVYDRLDVDLEDITDDLVVEKVAVHVGLTVKF